MCGYRLAVLLVIVFLLSPIATYTQTSLVQPSTSLSNTGDWQFPSAQRYREISIYSGQTFANPQIMSDLGGQHLFLAGARLTGRLITAPHLYISGNADVKPLALYYRDTGRGREYTYGGGGSVGLQFAPRREMRWLPYFDVDGRRVNTMIDFGPGLRISMHGNNAIKTGVWFSIFPTEIRRHEIRGSTVSWPMPHTPTGTSGHICGTTGCPRNDQFLPWVA